MTRRPDWEEVVDPDGQHYLLLARRIGPRQFAMKGIGYGGVVAGLVVFTVRWMTHVTVARLRWRITVSRIPQDADLRRLTAPDALVRADWKLAAMSKAETLEALDRISGDIMSGHWPPS